MGIILQLHICMAATVDSASDHVTTGDMCLPPPPCHCVTGITDHLLIVVKLITISMTL